MTQKTSRKELLKDDVVVESSVEIADWLEKHRAQLVRGAAAVGAVVVVVAAWTWWSASQRKDAQRSFDEGLRLLRPPAAQGAPAVPKAAEALAAFETAASKGGSSTTGLAARYYQAVCLLELGRGAESAPLFESVRWRWRSGASSASRPIYRRRSPGGMNSTSCWIASWSGPPARGRSSRSTYGQANMPCPEQRSRCSSSGTCSNCRSGQTWTK